MINCQEGQALGIMLKYYLLQKSLGGERDQKMGHQRFHLISNASRD